MKKRTKDFHIHRMLTAALVLLSALILASCTESKNTDPQATPVPTAPPVPKEIEFSMEAGFYAESSISVALTAPYGGEIYFTTDCSEPSAENPNASLYSEPITVQDISGNDGASDRVTVLKAVAVKDGVPGKVFTNTYILNSSAGSFSGRFENLAVFSISTDDAFLFGPDGIYTNYTAHGRETERAASIEFFETGGSREIAMQAGIRIYGGTSRGLAQKSLKITARKEYDEYGKFHYKLFPGNTDKNGKEIEDYDTVILRAGGNDSLLTGERSTQLRDALVHTLAKQVENMSSQAARPVAVYLNGNYWGLYFLREDLDDDYVESHYGTPKENVAILAFGHENGNWFYKLDAGTAADQKNYQEMLAYIASHNMQNEKYYQKACEMLDMDNFIKYMAINIYVNNRDWPHNNVRMWRYTGTPDPQNSYTDGKWRYMLKDVDFSWGRYHAPGAPDNVIATETAHNQDVIGGGGSEIAAAFSSLLKNSSFKADFMNFMCDVMNTYYSLSTAQNQIAEFQSLVTHEMQYQMTCTWNGKKAINMTVEKWQEYINDTLIEYVQKRPAQMKQLIKRTVSSKSNCSVIVKIENGGGKIILNTLDISNWATYVAEYYQNTDVKLAIEPFAGHEIINVTVESASGKASYADGILSLDSDTLVTVTVQIS